MVWGLCGVGATELNFWFFSKPHHEDQDKDIESSPDQSTRPTIPQANNSDQTGHDDDDLQQNSPNLTIISSSSGSASSTTAASLPERIPRELELTTPINSPSPSPISSSTMTPSSTQENLHANENPTSSPPPFHPIIESLRQQELSRHVLILAVPMTIGLYSVDSWSVNKPLALQVMAVAIALGFVGIWNGILLRTTWHEASNIIELLGIAFMLLAFFGYLACFLPASLIWIPFLCWFLSLLPFVIAFCFRGKVTKETERQDSNNRPPRRPPV